MRRIVTSCLVLFFIASSTHIRAQSGRENRRSAVMRGNLVKSVFGNWGVIGQPASEGKRGAWIYDDNGYVGDVSLMVGAEIEDPETGEKIPSVVVCPIARPTSQHEQSPAGKMWTFEPVTGYFNPNQEGIALYSDPDSWPTVWPDKMSDPEDPGWQGSWNGFFGKTTTATEEAYFIMDDNNDEEFNVANNNQYGIEFKPDSTNPARNGLGLSVKVRAMQWSDFLAQDAIFWLYEITNESTTDYSKAVFGMLVGTYVGVTSTEDFKEYDDDYSFFDVEKDLTYTGDFDDNATRNPRWTGDVGVVGYAFLESPSNEVDGIDNDGDTDAYPNVPAAGNKFTQEDFNPVTVNADDRIVLIDRTYQRTVVSVAGEPQTYRTRGAEIYIEPGVTMLAEGNVIEVDGEEVINPNAYDGVDNDLDGLIDENFYLHYRQIRKDQDGNILIDKLNPVRYKDFITGIGLQDAMIDEGRADGIDNDMDWDIEFDDVGADGVQGTGDRGEGDGIPTAGEPDFDQTDVDESDQIGLTSFEYFAPANQIAMADDQDLWRRLAPGFFEVPESIVNNMPERGEDGDFIYGSGYFPLRAGETKRFSLALIYGDGGGPTVEIDDLLKNRETVQKIYDSDYRFPPAPDRPTLTAVPGDGKVTLYWDRKAEKSFDPVLKKYDFEGYKIYKATDHNFNEVFGITDASGTAIAYKPLAQFDADDGVSGYFRPSEDLHEASRGASFYLGDDSGLEHSFIDYDVENGRRYFYAVVAYDRGDEFADVFPKENDKRIDIMPSGEVRTFQNTAWTIPNAEVIGYESPEGSVQLEGQNNVGTGRAFKEVISEPEQTGHSYSVSFLDTSNDGIDNNHNWNVSTDDVGSDGLANTTDPDGSEGNGTPDRGEPNLDEYDIEEFLVPITTSYSVRDHTAITKPFIARDTLSVKLPDQHMVEETITVADDQGAPVSKDKYAVDAADGRIRGVRSGDLKYGATYHISYEYYPIFVSPNIERSPWVEETLDTDIFDGLSLSFNNNWNVTLDTLRSGWSNPNVEYSFTFRVLDTNFGSQRLLGYPRPSDYRFEFYDEIADTSANLPQYFVRGVPVNFKVFSETDERYLDFVFVDIDRNNVISPFDEVIFMEPDFSDSLHFTWDVLFTSRIDTVYDLRRGDTLRLAAKKPFRNGDSYTFASELAAVNVQQAAADLNDIRVVPNPYVVATTHELPLPPAVTSGRGERKIDFIHLPAGARVNIFTARGEHVISLDHSDTIYDGTVSWNLKTKENLDVAPGVYFYVVESSVGNKAGKIGIIK